MLLQDGSRAHANKCVAAYAAKKNLCFVPDFPANSPDYNMIELVWALLKDGIGKRCPLTMDELKAAAVAAWDEIPQRVLNKYVLHFKHLMATEAEK